MDEQVYIQSKPARELLRRASLVSGTPLGLFRYENDREVQSAPGCGGCVAACAYVSKTPWGKQACRRSREDAATAALRRKKPVPFVCHMGFSCVAVQALAAGTSWALVFGPYYPDEAPDAVDHDVLDGLRALDRNAVDSLPFSLEDVPRGDTQAMPALAEWARDSLTAQYTAEAASVQPRKPLPESSDAAPPGRKKSQTGTSDASAALAALLSNDPTRARHILESSLTMPTRKLKREPSARRARCLMLVAAILEEAESGGADAAPCWNRMDDFTAVLRRDDDTTAWLKAAMYTLKPLRKLSRTTAPPLRDFSRLDALLVKHLSSGITLQEAARELDQNPTTLTKRLKRDFGISYSDYFGRLRVDRAKQLLQSTNLTVTAIARRVGLKDPSNFSKLFRKHAGTSPGAYRIRVRQHEKRQV